MFSGFIDFSNNTLYALLNWRYYTIIVIEKEQEKPIAFKSRVDFEYRAAVIDDKFILYFQKSEYYSMFSFTTASSLNSLQYFEMINYYPMEPSNVDLKFLDCYSLTNGKFDLGDNEEIKAKDKFDFDVERKKYKAIFGDDLWVVSDKLYNPLNILLKRTNWKLTERTSELEDIQYNILPFNDENRGNFEFEFSDNPPVLVNIPITIKKDHPQIYTFIVEVTYLNITRKSRLTIEILQWVDYWQLWANSTHCAKCIYEKIDEYTQDCMNIFIGNLYYIDLILWWFFMFAFIFWLFKFIPQHIYINALNYYQSVLLVLSISYLKHNSLKFAVTIFSSLCPYFTPFVLLRLGTINYDPVFSQDNKLLP